MSFVLVGVSGPGPPSTSTSKERPTLVCVILGKVPVLTMGDDWTILISGITMWTG